MSRELKFRAWDGKNMYDRVLPFQWDFVLNAMAHKCVKSNGSGILVSGGDTATFEIDGYRFTHIMQYTGMKDKNGKEIYEGDIIRYDLRAGLGEPEIKYKKREVKFYVTGYFSSYDENIEVIGNIHQHKHLLS